MRQLIGIIVLCISFNSFSLDETQRYRMTNDIFGYLHIDQWIDYVKRIKTDEDIPNYYNYPPVSKETKYYYKKFDILGYEEGLRAQITKNVSGADLQAAHKVLKNPFVSKVLKALFLKSKQEVNFERQVLIARDEKVSAVRKPLIQSVYNLVSYKAMSDHMFKTIQANEKEQKEIEKVLQKDNENIIMSKNNDVSTKRSEVEHVFHIKIDTALEKFTENELRQFVGMIKKESVQRFLSVYNTYDYFFVYKYDQMLYRKQKVDMKKGLKFK